MGRTLGPADLIGNAKSYVATSLVKYKYLNHTGCRKVSLTLSAANQIPFLEQNRPTLRTPISRPNQKWQIVEQTMIFTSCSEKTEIREVHGKLLIYNTKQSQNFQLSLT